MTARPINNYADLGSEVVHLLDYNRRREIAERQPGGVSKGEQEVLLRLEPSPNDYGCMLTIWWLDYIKIARNYAACIEENGKILALLDPVVGDHFDDLEPDESYGALEVAEAAVEELEDLRSTLRNQWGDAPKTQEHKSLKARLQTWHEELRESQHQPLLSVLVRELEARFPELLGSEVELPEPAHELHPMQQVVWGPDGVIRFRQNQIVWDLVEHARTTGLDLNHIACRSYTREDRMQFEQLLGRSVSAYGESDHVTQESLGAADRAAEKLVPKA